MARGSRDGGLGGHDSDASTELLMHTPFLRLLLLLLLLLHADNAVVRVGKNASMDALVRRCSGGCMMLVHCEQFLLFLLQWQRFVPTCRASTRARII